MQTQPGKYTGGADAARKVGSVWPCCASQLNRIRTTDAVRGHLHTMLSTNAALCADSCNSWGEGLFQGPQHPARHGCSIQRCSVCITWQHGTYARTPRRWVAAPGQAWFSASRSRCSNPRKWQTTCLHAQHDCDMNEASWMPPDMHPRRRLTSDYHGPRGLRRWRGAGGLICGMSHGAHQVPAAGAQRRHAAGEKCARPS